MGPVTESDLERALADCASKPVAACITSPTYFGVLANIPGLAKVCESYGTPLVVDAAHGAHMLFTERHPAQGAALYVCSAHKTLPALGQSALLFSDGRFDTGRVRAATALFGSTSPSYLLMASLDAARGYMLAAGRAALEETAAAVAVLRGELPGLPAHFPVDPLRLTVDAAAYGMTGGGLATLLEREHKMVCEASAGRYAIFLFSPMDGAAAADRLGVAMAGLNRTADTPPLTEVQSPGAAWPRWDENNPVDILAFFENIGYTVLSTAPEWNQGGLTP
jgi:arginine/lysine/ornithine decarboxylase